MSTANLFWLRSEFERIVADGAADRLPHALMLSGIEGIGVYEFAEDIARYRLCDRPILKRSADKQVADRIGACGECKSCKLMARGTHPDLKVFEPEGAAQIIKVDQIRSIIEFVSQTPQISDWKTIIIRPAHRMNPNASNALLKALEEPPGNTVLILATDRPQVLLPTIRSRCATIRLSAPTESQAVNWLEAENIDSEMIQSAIQTLGAKPLKIKAWHEQNLFETQRKIHSTLEGLSSDQTNAVDAAKALSTLDKSFLMNALINEVAKKLKSLSYQRQEAQDLQRSHRLFSRYEASYDLLLEAKRMTESGSNPNMQLLLESIFIRWPVLNNASI